MDFGLGVGEFFYDDFEGVFVNVGEIKVGVVVLIVYEVEYLFWCVEFIGY